MPTQSPLLRFPTALPEPSTADVRLAGPPTYAVVDNGTVLEVTGRIEYYDDPIGPFGSANFGSICSNEWGQADAQVGG